MFVNNDNFCYSCTYIIVKGEIVKIFNFLTLDDNVKT